MTSQNSIIFTLTSEDIFHMWDEVTSTDTSSEELDNIARASLTSEESLRLITENPNVWPSTYEYIYEKALLLIQSQEKTLSNFGRRLAVRLASSHAADFQKIKHLISAAAFQKKYSETIIISAVVKNPLAPSSLLETYFQEDNTEIKNRIAAHVNTPLRVLNACIKHPDIKKEKVYLNPNFPVNDCIGWLIEQSVEKLHASQKGIFQEKINQALDIYKFPKTAYEEMPFSWKLEMLKTLHTV